LPLIYGCRRRISITVMPAHANKPRGGLRSYVNDQTGYDLLAGSGLGECHHHFWIVVHGGKTDGPSIPGVKAVCKAGRIFEQGQGCPGSVVQGNGKVALLGPLLPDPPCTRHGMSPSIVCTGYSTL
jgi:hypothetical protein